MSRSTEHTQTALGCLCVGGMGGDEEEGLAETFQGGNCGSAHKKQTKWYNQENPTPTVVYKFSISTFPKAISADVRLYS